MIYKSAPAWSLNGKGHDHKQTPTPAPVAYNPVPTSTLSKSPSWKIGKQIRTNNHFQKSPSPDTYHPQQPQKINKMGIIGHQKRTKQNVNPFPGPGSYKVSSLKQSQSISFAKKHQTNNQNSEVPGPGRYNTPQKREKRGAVIGKQARFTIQNSELLLHPGPGNYQWNRPSTATIRFDKAPRMSYDNAKEFLVGPGQYQIKSELERNLAYKRGPSLGQKQKHSPPTKTPGPADYSPTRKDLPTTPSITFSTKYKEKSPDMSPSSNQYDPKYENIICRTENYSIGKAQRLPIYGNSKIPGPGSYLKTSYTHTGADISLGMSRKIQQKDDFPGPGAYNPKSDAIMKRPASAKLGKSKRFYKMNTQASHNFYDSKIELKTPKYSFSKTKKLDEKGKEGPGPGSYEIPSSLCNLSSYVSRH